ncbi:MAG: Hpt domain-containing protein [Chloracidobacterium sp.]|nr:Hpt domain-containing protein [Chloracidobacterium sp.]MDW8217802.1 Hpt domain-containing protein [Acidobacteriota bacterium]
MNVLDPETIASLKALDEGDGFFAEMVETFLSNARSTLERLCATQSANDIKELERAAHKLRGAASTVGAQSLMKLCEELERAAQQGDIPDAAARVAAIKAAFQEVVVALEAERQA